MSVIWERTSFELEKNELICFSYSMNPNRSALGIAGLTSYDGRHLAMMSHSGKMHTIMAIPWCKMFYNAYDDG
uniref:Uncharacterized protein n=1 Tax=Tetranychus urticae TaxID=32264 RepID=T1KB33_TETUR